MKVYQYLTGRSNTEQAYSYEAASIGLPFSPSWMRGEKRNDIATLNMPITEVQTDGFCRFVWVQSRTVNQRLERENEGAAAEWKQVRTYFYSHYLLADADNARELLADDGELIGRMLLSDWFMDIPQYQKVSEEQQGQALPVLTYMPEQIRAQHDECAGELVKPDEKVLAACLAKIWEACWQRARGEATQRVYLTVTPAERVQQTVTEGVRFFSRYILKHLPSDVVGMISMAIGTHFNAQDNQAGSACYILANEGISVQDRAGIFDFAAPVQRSADNLYDEDLLLGNALLQGTLPSYVAHVYEHSEVPLLRCDYEIAALLSFCEGAITQMRDSKNLEQLPAVEQAYDTLQQILSERHGLSAAVIRMLLLPVERDAVGFLKENRSPWEQGQSLRWLRQYARLHEDAGALEANKTEWLREAYEELLCTNRMPEQNVQFYEAMHDLPLQQVAAIEGKALRADIQSGYRLEDAYWSAYFRRADQAHQQGHTEVGDLYVDFLFSQCNDAAGLRKMFQHLDRDVLAYDALHPCQAQMIARMLIRYAEMELPPNPQEWTTIQRWMQASPALARDAGMQEAGAQLLAALWKKSAPQEPHFALMTALKLQDPTLDRAVAQWYRSHTLETLLNDQEALDGLTRYIEYRGKNGLDDELTAYLGDITQNSRDEAQNILALARFHKYMKSGLIPIEQQVLTCLERLEANPLIPAVVLAVTDLFRGAQNENKHRLSGLLVRRFTIPAHDVQTEWEMYTVFDERVKFQSQDNLEALRAILAPFARRQSDGLMRADDLSGLLGWVSAGRASVEQAAGVFALHYEQLPQGMDYTAALLGQMRDLIEQPPFQMLWPGSFPGKRWDYLRFSMETETMYREIQRFAEGNALGSAGLVEVQREMQGRNILPADVAQPGHQPQIDKVHGMMEKAFRDRGAAFFSSMKEFRDCWSALDGRSSGGESLLARLGKQQCIEWINVHYASFFSQTKEDAQALRALIADLQPMRKLLEAQAEQGVQPQGLSRYVQMLEKGLSVVDAVQVWQDSETGKAGKRITFESVGKDLQRQIETLCGMDPAVLSDVRSMIAQQLSQKPFPTGHPAFFAAHLLANLCDVGEQGFRVHWARYLAQVGDDECDWEKLDVWKEPQGVLGSLHQLFAWFDQTPGLEPAAQGLLCYLCKQEGATQRAQRVKQLKKAYRQLHWKGQQLDEESVQVVKEWGGVCRWLFGSLMQF